MVNTQDQITIAEIMLESHGANAITILEERVVAMDGHHDLTPSDEEMVALWRAVLEIVRERRRSDAGSYSRPSAHSAYLLATDG